MAGITRYSKTRAVGNPEKRLEEDALRGYRYLRMAITKGFKIEEYLQHVLRNYPSEKLENVSTERIREELLKMFSHDSKKSFDLLYNFKYPWLEVAFERGIKLLPSLRQ